MKTKIILLLGQMLALTAYGQGWNAHDLGTQTNHINGSMVEHNGKLFVENASNRISVSTDGGVTFTDITTDTIPGSIRYMVSAGNRLYVGTYNQGNAEGNLWYTTDEGLSWQTDTVGVPHQIFSPTLKRDIYALISYNNGTQLLASWGGGDGYMRKAVTDAAWTKISFFDPIDPIAYTASNDTVLAVNSNTVYYSTDNAVTWTALGKTSLPSFFVPKGFDIEGGRIYLGTDATIQQKFSLFYTDDFGTTWDTLPVNHLIGKSWLGQPQRPGTLKAIGNNVYLSLVNNKGNSPLNLISSSDGGATFSHDTTGLKNDQFGTGILFKFLEHKGKVFAMNNYQTLYSKGISVGLTENRLRSFSLYPNPATDRLHLDFGGEKPTILRVYNSRGQLVLEKQVTPNGEISIENLLPGFYWLKAGGFTRSFVKN